MLEGGVGSVEDKDWLDSVVEELADAVEEHHQVGVGQRVSVLGAHALHCLVQPNADVCKKKKLS